MKVTATRYHDFSAGHRVVGHEGKCRFLHGHNYRVHFEVRAHAESPELDSVGRVLDFDAIKTRLCQWIEDHWDHRMLLWEKDPTIPALGWLHEEPIVRLPFNPTAENMALYLLHQVGPAALEGTGVRLVCVTLEETRKCSATASL